MIMVLADLSLVSYNSRIVFLFCQLRLGINATSLVVLLLLPFIVSGINLRECMMLFSEICAMLNDNYQQGNQSLQAVPSGNS